MDNSEHTNIWSVPYMDNWTGKRRSDNHCIELWSRSPFESEILNVLRMNQVNSLVETWVNDSLSYLEFYIKVKHPLIKLQSQNGLVYTGIDLNPETGK